MLPADVAGLASALQDLNLDPVIIEAVCSQLHTQTTELETDKFDQLGVIATPSFGGSTEGGDLGLHHDLAQKVVSDTILGVVQDLITFRDGVVKAREAINDSDLDSADEMRMQQEALDLMAQSYTQSQGDAANASSKYDNVTTGAVDR